MDCRLWKEWLSGLPLSCTYSIQITHIKMFVTCTIIFPQYKRAHNIHSFRPLQSKEDVEMPPNLRQQNYQVWRFKTTHTNISTQAFGFGSILAIRLTVRLNVVAIAGSKPVDLISHAANSRKWCWYMTLCAHSTLIHYYMYARVHVHTRVVIYLSIESLKNKII